MSSRSSGINTYVRDATRVCDECEDEYYVETTIDTEPLMWTVTWECPVHGWRTEDA